MHTAGAFAVPKLSAACVPWDLRLHLLPQANLSYGYTYYTLGPGLGAWERAPRAQRWASWRGLPLNWLTVQRTGTRMAFPSRAAVFLMYSHSPPPVLRQPRGLGLPHTPHLALISKIGTLPEVIAAYKVSWNYFSRSAPTLERCTNHLRRRFRI